MRIFSSMRGKTLLVGAATVITAAVATGTALAGWGPGRPTFTWSKPATYVTFNSFTDNPKYGDERAFFDGRNVNSSTALDTVQVNDNDELSLRVFFHNNAAENLNLVATNTRVSILLPKTAKTSTFSTAGITADNANPREVWDTVDFTGARPFNLEYVPGSAQLWNNVFRGAQLSDSIVTSSGALVGFDKIDGRVPGCERFAGFVTIKARVKMQPVPVTPAFSCDALNATVSGRKVDANVAFTATGGATFKSTTFDWGDGNKNTVNTTSASHTYGADGTFTINATLTFDVGGTEKTSVCTKSVTITTPPVTPPVTPPAPTPPVQVGKALPATGPAGVAGLFAGVSAIAGAAHYMWGRRFGA